MPLFQHYLYEDAEIIIWKIEETEDFFKEQTGLASNIAAHQRRLEYYAGRYVLQRLIPDLQWEDLHIVPNGKPYIKGDRFQFSISHSYPYIAVVIHEKYSVGIDIQIFKEKILRVYPKFISESEKDIFDITLLDMTMLWSIKEALFKWRSTGGQDFKSQLLVEHSSRIASNEYLLQCKVVEKDDSYRHIEVKSILYEDFALAVAVGNL